MEPEASENLFQQIQNKGSASEPTSEQYLTQERANAAIGPKTSLQNIGNVSTGGNQFNLKGSPYMQTATSQSAQEFIGAAGEVSALLLSLYGPAFAAAAVPSSALVAGATGGSGIASNLAGMGAGMVTVSGLSQAVSELTGPGGIRGQQEYQRLNSPIASTAGEVVPMLSLGLPFGKGSWNAGNVLAGAGAGAVNAVAHQGIYNPQATPEENAIEIAKQSGMMALFGASRPTPLGEAVATVGGNIGLNNPLYRGAVKSTIFNGGEAPAFTDGAVNGVSFKQPGGTATIYDPVSGTGRVLYRNTDGTVTSVNYNNLAGQAAKNSGQSTFGIKDSGPGSPDFTISRFGTPPTKQQGPIDVQSTPVEPTGPIGRGRQLNEPQWGQQGDVGKPNGRGPAFGQEAQAPGPVTTETAPTVQTPKTPAAQSPASAVAPAVEAPAAPIPSAPTPVATAPVTPVETKPEIPNGNAPARPTPADFGIPENPSMEWHSKPENQKLWTKYSNSVNQWDMDYAMTHTADGRPLSQGSTEAPQAPKPADSPAVAVSGVETPTAPIPKPSVEAKPGTGTATATAERPPLGEIPGPAQTGQTPAITGTGQATEIPGQKPTGTTQQTAGGEPVVPTSEPVILPKPIVAPIIPERKKDATREEILSGARGMDEASYGVDQSFTNDERKQHFENRAKHLLTTDPSKLNDKDVRDRARIVGSSKPEVMSDSASYDGPKLPSFIEAGIASGKTLKDIYDSSEEIQKTEFTDWLQNYQIWMDSISHDNKPASEIATSATPESIANQNHAIADAGYRPVENDVTKDIKAGGQVVAISDWNNATYDKAKLNHDENVYLRHPQTKKVVSIRMPNGDLNHYTVSGPLFVNGLARDANGKIISDDAISMYEAKVSGKPTPVGTPTVLQFAPNAATSVERILNSGSLLPRHTNKIPASTKPAQVSQPASEVAKPTPEPAPEPETKPQTLTKVTAIESVISQEVRKEPTETDIVITIGLRGLKTQAQVYNSILNGIANLEYQASENAGFEKIEYIGKKVYIDGKKMGSINPKTGDFTPVNGKEPFEVKTKLEAFSFGYLHASNSALKMLYEKSIATRLTDLSAQKKKFIIKLGDSNYVYTISANPVSVRMFYEQMLKLGKSFFADLVGMEVPTPEPAQPADSPVVTAKPEPAAEIPAPATTPVAELPVAELPVASKPAVKEINTAVGKVNDQIEKLIDLGNTKSAKNVFDTVLARLQEIEDEAVADSGFRNVEYIKETKRTGNVYVDGQPLDVFFEKNNISEKLQKEVKNKITIYRSGVIGDRATPSELKRVIELDVSNLLSKGKYIIKIPGDGTFKIAANPVAIRTLYRNIKSEGSGLWKGLSKYINKNNEQKENTETEQEIDSKIAEAEEAESKAIPPIENVDEAWKEHNKNQESQIPISTTPSEDAIPSAVKSGKKYKNALSITVKGKEIIIKGRGDYKPKVSEFDIEWQNLINAYASEDAAPLRNGAFPAFFDNSDLGGGWITAPIPMTNGNFLIYETNPRGKEAEGNAANRTVRLFRYVVNSSGNQLIQPFEVSRNELKGFRTKDGSFAIPALVHAMIAAAADYAKNKSMSVSEVQEISGGKVTLTGIIDSQLKDYEDNSIAPPGIRGRMEEFNALPHGGSINNAIVLFMADPVDNENAKNLLYELENNGNLSKEAAKAFIREIISAQGGDQEIINFNIVRTPNDDSTYPADFDSRINKQSAKLILDWLMRGKKSLVTEVGADDPATGIPLPEQIQKPGNNPSTGKPWVKAKKGPDGKVQLDDKGNPITEPWMVPNPRRWLIKYGDYVNEETYHVKDSDGKTLFKPMPYQIRGINAALSRFLGDSTPVSPGQVGRAFLNMDAPGLGKTIQILGTAKAWHEKMKVWTKDPNSPWFGKPAKVLIVSQNRTILKNAFGGDAQKMGLDLSGKFEDVGGGNIKFIPNKTTGTDEGGLSIDGEESWIDFATYGDIKPQMEQVPVFLDKDKKVPKMVPKYVVVDGEFVKGPDGKPMIEQQSDGKGGTKDVMVQATEDIPNGPPKKGAGEWGLVVFDECHNMKNMESGRSQAGHDLFIRSQHIMLATGTPIDKPHLLGYFIAMVLDVSLHDIAPELQMKVEGSKMSKTRRAKGFTAQDFRDSLSIEHWSKLSKDKQQEIFMLALLGIRKIRDRAGNLGRLIRRGKAFYGIPDLWFDCTDSMDPVAKEMIIKHEIEWAIKIESAPAGSKRNVIGQFLMESKRLAACIKLGVPGTQFNPSTEPKGALRIMLNEIRAGRKVIITVDTTNEAGKLDPDLKGKFKGLIGADGYPTSYDSEFTMLKSYLDKNGIKYGTIVGADVKDRQKSISNFQENNMDTPVIIMTVASGGTGLSLQDLFNLNRNWGYDPKTGLPDLSAGVQGEDERTYIGNTSNPQMPSYDKPLPTDSHPRSMIIVSAPWGGDAVEQVIGRADRMNTTTPTRVFWMTTEIASGDKRLIQLVRAKIATLEAMIKYGDDLDALIAGGIEGEGVQSPTSAATMGQSRKLPLEAAKTLAKTALQSALTGAKSTKDNNEQKIADTIAEDPELSVPANKRSVSRWRSALKKANALIDSITVALKELDEGKLDPYSVDPRKIKEWLEARGLSPTGESEDGSDIEELDEGDDESMNNIYRNIINKNVVTNTNGIDMIVSAGKTKASRNRISNIVQHIYGLQSSITPSVANPVMNEKVIEIVNAIVRPYRSAYANGEINSRRFAAMLGFARDIAWRLQDYTINSIYASTPEEMREKAEMQAAGAINIAAKELMTLLFKEDVAKKVYGKAHLNAKSSMYTTFHEVGHALMRLIPDDIKAGMFKELEAARTSWFESLPEGDVRKSLSMPEVDWHYTSGIRNITFGKTTVTRYPLGIKYSKDKKTYDAISLSLNSKIHPKRGHDADFFVSAMVSLALAKFAEHPEGLNDKSMSFKLKSVADIEMSGVGRDGQFGFKNGAGAIAPFLSLFSLGVGYNLGQLTNTSVPIVELSITKTSNPSDGLEKTTGSPTITTGAIHNMIKDGNGYITVSPKNPNHAIITSILPGGKLTYITIDAKKFLTEMSNEFLNRIKGKNDSEKLSFLHDGNILKEFIHGATGEDYLRQKQNIERTNSGTFENRIYRLTNIDEWLAENTAAYCRDYYMLGNFSEEVSMSGDIVSSLFVHASSGGDGRLTRRIISSILHNTIPYTDTATQSGNDYYSKYGTNYNTPRNQSQQSGSLSPPNADINLNPLPRGMSVTEDSLLKSGRGAAFSASSIRTVKKWASTIGELRDWAVESAHNLVPSQKNLKKLYEGIRKRAGEAKSVASAPFTYYGEGLLGTLIGQIEQIGRITDNDLVKELGKRLYNRPDTGELSRNTFTEDMTVYQNYWQAVFNEIIEKHLGEKIKNSAESRDRLLSFNKVFTKTGKSVIAKKEFSDSLAKYILNVLHPDYNKLNRYLDEAREYLKEQKWSELPSEIKDYLDEISTSRAPDARIKLLESLIQQIEIAVGEEARRYGNGSNYDQISFGRESDSYLGDFFEEGTIDKILMDVGRCMSVSRNRPDYDAYVKSKFSKEVIDTANELTKKWAAPYRAWSESMGEDISDWGTSWRPRVIDSDSINGIREGVRNKIDSFIQKAAETIYKDNKHQRVLLPAGFIEFFESENYFLDVAVPYNVKNPTKTPAGVEQILRMFMEWSSGPMPVKYDKTPTFLLERINKIKLTSLNSEQKIVDDDANFGFDVSIKPEYVRKGRYINLTDFETTKALGIAVALKAYKKLLKDMFETEKSTFSMNPKIASAYMGEHEMLDKAITRLEEQHNRKIIESNLTKIEAYKLAKKFADRTLHKSLGIASSGDGYSDIFGEQFGDLNKADSLQQRLMECEFADELLSDFYTNDVRIFGKHYNKEVTRTILIKHHIPEQFWNSLRKSVIANPESTHYWKDICWNVRRITESDQEESGSGLINSMLTLAAHSLYMTATASLQFAEPLVFGATFKHKNPMQAAQRAAMGSAGNLRIVMTSIANSLASVSVQLATLGNKDVENMPGLKNFTKEDEFYTRLARRVGIIQNKYLEGLDTSTADKRGLVQRMSDLALERFHNCGSGLTAVTNASRVAVMKSTIIALEQMADEIITRTKAKNQNGEWIRGEELNVLTPDELMQFRNLGIYESELSNFLQFCSTYRASISGDYSTMSPEMMDELIDKKTHITPRVMRTTKRNPFDAERDNRIARNYFNAIARINFMTVQVSSRATEQRARAAFQRLTSAGTARSVFFLSHYNSSLSRNVLVPAARVLNSAFKNKQKQFAASPGSHDPAMRKGTLPTGAYVSDISNPYAGFRNSAKALTSLTAVFAMMAAANFQIRQARTELRKNPAIYIIDEPTTALKVVASFDSAGFLGNASLPLNIMSGGIRFNRSASQIAAGAFPGKVYGTIDDIRNAYGPNNRNSPNTPTAERRVAGNIYDIIAIPFATTLLSYTLPQTNVGDMLLFTSVQSMAHPGVKEAFKRGWPGSGEAVPRTKAELDSLYREGKIGYTEYRDALTRRLEWEAKNPRQKQAPGERDRR